MSNDIFFDLCKREVVEYFNQHADKTDQKKIPCGSVWISCFHNYSFVFKNHHLVYYNMREYVL
mgnify:CR=1 FL=1